MADFASGFPDMAYGVWNDLYWVGNESLAANPGIAMFLYGSLGPVGFAKFYCPLALLFFGLAMWVFLRTLGFNATVCALGALAAALNGNRFSVACWGLPSWVICGAGAVLALAAVARSVRTRPFLMSCLAGLGTGVAVSEGFDTGALLSLLVAAYAVFVWLTQGEVVKAAAPKAMVKMGLLVLCAVMLASHILLTLVSTQIKGVAGTAQDEATRRQQWDFATQWSMPVAETARLAIPGLYGYRMDTPDGGNYWGGIGRSPGWEKTGMGIPRHSGSGEYAGLLVVLLALFGVANSFRSKDGPFTVEQRRHVWFWSAVGLLSLLMAYGRHAPVFQLFYALPYMSTIRSPLKFLHIVHFALIILFAYGLHGLIRIGSAGVDEASRGVTAHVLAWWRRALAFDRRWVAGLGGFAGLAIFCVAVFGAKRQQFVEHLTTQAFDARSASAISHFVIGELALFLVLLLVSGVAIVVVQSGFWGGRRAKWIGIILGLIMIVDFGHANRPWVRYWNYNEKYAANPVTDFLKKDAHEHRVTVFPFQISQDLGTLQQLYGIEWTQHLFPYNNIQTLDITQEPRTLEDDKKYREALAKHSPATLIRLWELTNTKYIVGLGGQFASAIGPQLDAGRNRFRLHSSFNIVAKKPGTQPTSLEDVTVQTATNGVFGLVEFTGALPRAKLYRNWSVSLDETETLSLLTNVVFDPHQSVIVGKEIPMPQSAEILPGGADAVRFKSYHPRKIVLEAEAGARAVLLLNDKYSPKWTVTVDGEVSELLRCNYLMRGVVVPPGKHEIVFRYEPHPPALTVTLLTSVAGLGLLIFVFVVDRRREDQS
ncbi:MAG: hypothetical protein ISQ14_00450 [Verrucomicrobiae bacterium]|nr:hypothetical protein [Verrucomicrobiae bacterium]